jgi:hypothetical protein
VIFGANFLLIFSKCRKGWQDVSLELAEDIIKLLRQSCPVLLGKTSSKAKLNKFVEGRMLKTLQATRSTLVRNILNQLASEQIPSTENHYLVDVIKKHRTSTLLDEVKELGRAGSQVSFDAVTALIQKHQSVQNQSVEEFEAQELKVILQVSDF